MLKPLALGFALRYMRAKRRNHFISFISFISMIGIALGVTVLITVLSVMNGFDREIKTRLFGVARQMTINTMEGALPNWQQLAKKLQAQPAITDIAPFIDGQALLTSEAGGVRAAALIAVEPSLEIKMANIESKMLAGSLLNLKPGEFNIVLGDKLAQALGVTIGDRITVMVPQSTLTPVAQIPRERLFTVAGIFQIGNGFGFDNQLSFIHLRDGQALYLLGQQVSGIRLKLHDLYDAPQLNQQLQKTLPEQYQVHDWTQDYGSFFEVIRMEKSMMFILLALIIAVAAFNLVATLVMVVNDKRADIAILRTLGATPSTILSIFIAQGIIVGMIGTLLGLIGGVLLASNVTALVNFLQNFFHVQLLSSSYYFVDYLPSQILMSDLVQVCVIALLLSLVATLYPAWNAAKTQPAEALRYE